MDKQNSIFTIIYWQILDKTISPDQIFILSELFWPKFIKKDNYVFLKENFSEKEYNKLLKSDSNPEYWINLLTIDCFFSGVSNGEEKSAELAKKLVEIWEAKLKSDFPSLDFIVEYQFDTELGDYGLTFYQDSGSVKSHGSIEKQT